MNILGYELVNEDKLSRAKHGTVQRMGQMVGGLDELVRQGKLQEDTEEYDKALLAEYDKLGGLVLKNNLKVKIGSFYDFKRKTLLAEPDTSFEMNLDGDLVTVTEEEALAIKSAKNKKNELKERKMKERDLEKPKKLKIKVKDLRDDQ